MNITINSMWLLRLTIWALLALKPILILSYLINFAAKRKVVDTADYSDPTVVIGKIFIALVSAAWLWWVLGHIQ